jgi:hypothetical protein
MMPLGHSPRVWWTTGPVPVLAAGSLEIPGPACEPLPLSAPAGTALPAAKPDRRSHSCLWRSASARMRVSTRVSRRALLLAPQGEKPAVVSLCSLPLGPGRMTACQETPPFSLLKQYVTREGNAHVPKPHDEDGFALGQWVAKRRLAFQHGRADPRGITSAGTAPRLVVDPLGSLGGGL